MAYSDGSYRIRAGVQAIASVTSAYAVTAFPTQADQPAWLRWTQPIDPSGAYSEVAVIEEAIDGSLGGLGGIEFEWNLAPMTPLMVYYWRNTVFAGKFSKDFTVMTWDRGYGWRYVYARAQWRDPAKIARPRGYRGYMEMKIKFVNGVEVIA